MLTNVTEIIDADPSAPELDFGVQVVPYEMVPELNSLIDFVLVSVVVPKKLS